MKKRVLPLPPDKTAWYLRNPGAFDINRLEANEMSQGPGQKSIAKIPQIKDRICIEENEGGNERLVKFVIGRETDSETGETKEETVIIGSDISGALPGMMLTEDIYHDYFDVFGNLGYDPMKPKATNKITRLTSDKPGTNKQTGTDTDNPRETETDESLAERLKRRIAEELKEKNEVKLGGKTYVRIPDIPGIRFLPSNKHGNVKVEYVHDHWYDPIKKQNRNRKTIIGDASDEYPGAMIPNDRYGQMFDSRTGLPYGYKTPEEEERIDQQIQEILRNADEMKRKEEEQELLKAEQERFRELYGEDSEATREEAAYRISKVISESYDRDPEAGIDDTEDDEDDEDDGTQDGPDDETQTEPNDEPEDINMLYDQITRNQERPAVLVHILDAVIASIGNQARKHPDHIINAYKARKINNILIEIKLRYQGSGYEDLLELLQEPEEVEENGQKFLTGMTYSDAEILLNHYTKILKFVKPKDRK